MKHYCHAKNCNTQCEPEKLMCLKHWKMVPYDLQRKVWATYRPGQCDDKNPSEAWHKAADDAIESVEKFEKNIGIEKEIKDLQINLL